jgi:hypothetical protein
MMLNAASIPIPERAPQKNRFPESPQAMAASLPSLLPGLQVSLEPNQADFPLKSLQTLV